LSVFDEGSRHEGRSGGEGKRRRRPGRSPDGFSSNAEFVKSKTNGPTAKSFNLNFAALYDQIGSTKTKPSNIWSGDEEARGVVEQLIRDADYDPAYAGSLEDAAAQEAAMGGDAPRRRRRPAKRARLVAEVAAA
jgi:predicted dinucleotide-binding enzyme